MLALVSIVIPVFNQKEAYLLRCVTSALAQNHPNLEVIVSDNHSTNGCIKVLSEITDSRLAIVKPPFHLPLVQHFAFAGFQAHGEYISFLPSDDWLQPNWLQPMLKTMTSHPDASIAYCDVYRHNMITNQVSRYRGNRFVSKFLSSDEAIKVFGKFICKDTSAYMIGALVKSKNYFKCGGFHDTGATYAGDACMGLGLLKYGGVVYINEALANYTIWTSEQGKIDEQYAVAACLDIAKVLVCAECDPALLEIANVAGFSFKKMRVRLTIFFLLNYIQQLIEDEKTNIDYASFQVALKIISKGWVPIWVSSVFKLSIVINIMSFLRKKFGEKAKSKFL